MNDLAERVAEKMRQLPLGRQQEVLRFVEFLQTKQVETDNISEESWLAAIEKSPALEFLHDVAEDIYSLQDGKPYTP
jgi:hypothetical protein